MNTSAFALPAVALPVSAALPRLDPAQLEDLALAAEQALLRQGESANTLRSYRSALRYWSGWFALRYGRPISLPVAPTTVVQFIVDHALRADNAGTLTNELPHAVDQALVAHGVKAKPGPLALNTLVHRIAVLSKLHQSQSASNPCEQPRVRELLAMVRRGYAKRGAIPRKAPALTREPLQALLDTCDDSLGGLRDRALLLFAFASGGRRRSEVCAARVEQLRAEGPGFAFRLGHSKTNQSAVDRAEDLKPVYGVAAQALTAWLDAARITSGPIFRRVRRGGVIGEPLSPSAVRDIVIRRTALAGLPEGYAAHSLRAGFVTEAGRQGVPLGDTMAMTGHSSPASVMGYFRAGAARLGRSAALMDSGEPITRPGSKD